MSAPADGKKGTEVTFLPSPATFTKTEFDFATLEHRLRELAFLNSGVSIILTDKRGVEPKEITLHYEGGLKAFVEYLDRAKQQLIPAPVMIVSEKDGVTVEIAMTWNDSYHESTLAFTNNIPQRDGGTHVAGFRAGLTRVVTKYADDMPAAKKDKTALTGDDCREGLTCVLSVKVPDPEILVPDQGQAGVVGSAPHRGRRHDRPAGRLVRTASRRSQDPWSARWWKPPPPAKPPARRAN